MTLNLTALRREAYKMWKINPHHVIFDFAKTTDLNCFCFKFNYDKKYSAWPKSYVLSFDNNDTEVRTIAPIISFKKRGKILIKKNEWYDMPFDVHTQIVKIVDNNNVERTMSFWKNIFNLLLPEKNKYQKKVKIEDYVYVVVNTKDGYIVKAV